jgi:hypothetical protein
MMPGRRIGVVRLNKITVNVAGGALTVALCVGGMVLAQALPHHQSLGRGGFIIVLTAFLLLIPVHEWLHGLGARVFGKVPREAIRFGVMWDALAPYCHCSVPLTKKAYCRMALLPLWVTGSLSLGALLLCPCEMLGMLTGLALAGCIGDVWIVARLRRFGNHVFVVDSPKEIGCEVYEAVPESA